MKTSLLLFTLLAMPITAQNGPQPRVVTPGTQGSAPSDAVVLFDGKDLSRWTQKDGSPTGCTVEGGIMVCLTGSKDAWSTEKFDSAQIHLEFLIPAMPESKGQLRGNSGVYLHGRYEIQVLDSFENPTYADGSLGSLYRQYAPLVNASRPPEQWQTYDMVFHAPKCNASGEVTEKATLTVLLNGLLVQDHVTVKERKDACTPGPLMLQDHSGFPGAPRTAMKFRNIWLRKL